MLKDTKTLQRAILQALATGRPVTARIGMDRLFLVAVAGLVAARKIRREGSRLVAVNGNGGAE